MGNRRLGAQRLQALMKSGAAELDTSYQAGTGIKKAVVSHKMFKRGGIIETQILVDLQGDGTGDIYSHTNDNSYIGEATAADATGAVEGVHLLLWENDTHGVIFDYEVLVVEAPLTGADDLILAFDDYAADEKQGNAVNTQRLELIDQGNALVAGDRHVVDVDGVGVAAPLAALTDVDGKGLYISTGESSTAAAYTAGKLLICLRGYDNQWGF